jgi:Carboxypeptidase regulatory-like domain
MRSFRCALVAVCGLMIFPAASFAQATLAGTVKGPSGAVLPGVTINASSPVLIEKIRTATTDAAGQYRIESLQPGTYTVTFTLSGFATLKHDDVIVSGTGVVKTDAEMRIGTVAETVTVTGESPVVDVQSTRRAITLDNETMRNLPKCPQLQLSAHSRARGLDIYNVTNSDTTLFYNTTFVPNVTGWQTSLAYMNPRVVRLNAEFAW